MDGGRAGEKEGQERGPSVSGGGLNEGFTPELSALLSVFSMERGCLVANRLQKQINCPFKKREMQFNPNIQ